MQRMTKLPLTSRPPNETSALLSVNKRSSAEEDEIKPCAKSAFSCPLFTTFFPPQLSKAPSTNGQSFLRRYFHNHYFNYFYGALSIAEWWLFLFTAALLLLRLTLMVYFHHNGRAGRVAEYTMVICILFSLRSGARFGSMLGIHGKNLMVFHKAFGTLVIVTGFIHAFPYFFLKNLSIHDLISSPQKFTGILLLLLVSFQPLIYLVKRNYFEIFYYIHVTNFFLLVYLANAHRAELIPLTSILWLLDIFNRVLLSSSAVSMTVTPSSCQQFAILSFSKDSTFPSCSPGTYSYLMVPELSYFESHPFSLLLNEKEKCMQQIIRTSGTWTKRLIESHSNQSVRGFLEGPYEGMPFHLKKSRHLLFLSGGIGVTPNLSILRHLQHQTHLLNSLDRLQFVWSLKQSDAELIKLVEITSTADALNHNKCDLLGCDIFFTQANNPLMGYHRLDEESLVVNGLRLHYGRVDINSCIREFMTQSRLEDETLEVITVFVSGPASMIEATLLSCNAISASQPRIRIDVQSESFCL